MKQIAVCENLVSYEPCHLNHLFECHALSGCLKSTDSTAPHDLAILKMIKNN